MTEAILPATSCSVSKGVGDATVIRGTVLAEELVYQNGSVLFDGAGRIVEVGCDVSTGMQMPLSRPLSIVAMQ